MMIHFKVLNSYVKIALLAKSIDHNYFLKYLTLALYEIELFQK